MPKVAASSGSQDAVWSTHPIEGPLSNLPDLEVIRRIGLSAALSQDPASGELRRRGYTDSELRIARRMVDPDPQIRMQLVRWLPQVPGIDARRWLLWLARDEEPTVRKAAITVLATAADPWLRQQLEQFEHEEQDPDVLQTMRSIRDPRRVD
jgi:hypothetical protein